MHLDLVLIYFVYGLAFFSMGLALALETGRSPLLAEKRALRPLAVFGLLHGLHEWLDIMVIQSVWLGQPFPELWVWFRITLLAISFLPLSSFAFLVLLPKKYRLTRSVLLSALLIGIFIVAGLASVSANPAEATARFDALARYILAIPGGLLAALAMRKRAVEVKTRGQANLSALFNGAAVGLALYGASQIFVAGGSFFPANTLNAANFAANMGFPIQLFRAAVAILVTLNLLRAIQIVEQEREQAFMAAQQARLDALEQIRQDLIEREIMRRDLLRHIVIAQEDERARVARELHDETAQILTALTLDLATLRMMFPKQDQAALLLERLQKLGREMSRGLYRLVHDLRPAQLDDLGLVAALQDLAEQEHQRTHLKIHFDVEGEPLRMDNVMETVIFRIAQEGLNNAARHAEVDAVWMRMKYSTDQVVVEIEDHGVGFDLTERLTPPRGWGLAGMRERVESVGGSLEIQSALGEGTHIRAIFTLTETTPGHSLETKDYEEYSINAG